MRVPFVLIERIEIIDTREKFGYLPPCVVSQAFMIRHLIRHSIRLTNHEYVCYNMNDSEVNKEVVVLEQLRKALGGISQESLSRMIGCSSRKIWRGENGTETTWTTAEAKNLHLLLQNHFGVGITDLPDRLNSSEPVPFLQSAIKQKSAEA